MVWILASLFSFCTNYISIIHKILKFETPAACRVKHFTAIIISSKLVLYSLLATYTFFKGLLTRHHSIQYNNTQYNDTQHNGLNTNNIQLNYTLNTSIEYCCVECWDYGNAMVSVIMLNVVMLSLVVPPGTLNRVQLSGCHNTQHKERNDTQHKDTQHNGIQLNDTQYEGLFLTLCINGIQHKQHSAFQQSVIMVSVIMLNVSFHIMLCSMFHFIKCYAQCHYAECCSAECCYAECYGTT
jgi:hypothetical protein